MKQLYHITMIVFVHYNVTYRYNVQNHEHPNNFSFAKQNIPGADKNLLPVLVFCLIHGIHAEGFAMSASTSATEREVYLAIFSALVSPSSIIRQAVSMLAFFIAFFSASIAASLRSR